MTSGQQTLLYTDRAIVCRSSFSLKDFFSETTPIISNFACEHLVWSSYKFVQIMVICWFLLIMCIFEAIWRVFHLNNFFDPCRQIKARI